MVRMKRRSPTTVDDEDSRLFREAIGDVRKLDPVAPPPAMPKPEPHPYMLEADEAAVPGELLDMAFDPGLMEVGEELSYLRDGYPPKLLRQLKRGQFSVQDEIDLHQMNAAAAQATISAFLAEASEHGFRCVRIVHGKGLRC
jgi:DNA-nicking Smr family endonuclease